MPGLPRRRRTSPAANQPNSPLPTRTGRRRARRASRRARQIQIVACDRPAAEPRSGQAAIPLRTCGMWDSQEVPGRSFAAGPSGVSDRRLVLGFLRFGGRRPGYGGDSSSGRTPPPSPATARLVESVVSGATDPEITGVELVCRAVLAAMASLGADGVVLGTPETSATRPGAVKYFFDQVFYVCARDTRGMPLRDVRAREPGRRVRRPVGPVDRRRPRLGRRGWLRSKLRLVDSRT